MASLLLLVITEHRIGRFKQIPVGPTPDSDICSGLPVAVLDLRSDRAVHQEQLECLSGLRVDSSHVEGSLAAVGAGVDVTPSVKEEIGTLLVVPAAGRVQSRPPIYCFGLH